MGWEWKGPTGGDPGQSILCYMGLSAAFLPLATSKMLLGIPALPLQSVHTCFKVTH